ncbi:MAG TPA: HsdR family type I site-specific deoxyribonuclease [Bacteroidales bacterium]|nr:HsdR family type I site-specific deoxyribonuclease [Bacteroidales bacterium]
MSSLGGERYSVQKPVIDYVQEQSAEYISPDGTRIFLRLGWEYIKPDDALRLRGGSTGIVFREIFINQMQRLNPDFMDNLMAEDIIRKLGNILPNIEGNFTAWEYLKGIKTVFVPGEKRERNIKFLDTADVNRNTFHVTDEFVFTSGNKTIRPDIVFLINGLPVLFVETKAAHKIEGVSEALEQVKRYHREGPELMAVMQIYTLTHILKYYYGATWNTSEKLLFNWKEESAGDFENLVKTFFDRERVIKLLADFIMFTRQDDELRKVVLRPHQMRAVSKITERAQDTKKKRGLVWHTQGSGKTYTMIVAARKIMENPLFENPTVIMLVDRNELESQLFGNIKSLGIEDVEVIGSKEHLQNVLSGDRRGLVVTMIHKFEGIPANINIRSNIFVMVDEAHRTTGGKLGNYLMGALPNAAYIGFTGTPIDKTQYGKGTFITFGRDDPPHGYLDKYSISESIEDGTTVPLYYTLAPNNLQVEKELLEKEFLDVAEAQGISDVEALNKVLEKAVTLRNMLKNRERVEKVISYIVDHYRNNIEPMGYKAFLVAVDREACAIYKEELDKYLPPDYSKVVYSPFYNDPPELARYHLSEADEKRIRKAFKKPDELPKILIVTEKLLTGFDAPILYCMYLDKPMRDHVLLQAIARVNRPYEDDKGRSKSSGFVLDFVGIFDNLEKALAFDSHDIEGIVRDVKVLKERFEREMITAKEEYLVLIEGKERDKAVEEVLERFRDEQERQEFYNWFKKLSDIYEIISPDNFLRPYIDDYETVSRMYKILKENYDRGTIIDRELTGKTAMLVREYTRSDVIGPTLDVYEIDENTLRRIEESKASDTEKIFNLIKSIERTAGTRSSESPYLISIAERAELLVELYENRQKNTVETLEELKKIIEEINSAQTEQIEKEMPAEVFTIYWMLKERGLKDAEAMANQMREVIRKYPHWQRSEKYEREFRNKLYQVIYSSGIDEVDKVTEIAQHIMKILKGVIAV